MPDTQVADLLLPAQALFAELKRQELDAFILPRFDMHQGEYVAPHDERLRYITGFSGSAGMAIVTQHKIAVFADGRYTVQLAEECTEPHILRLHLFDQPPEIWLAGAAQKGWKVGFDPMHIPPVWYDRFAAACDAAQATLVALDANPVDAIWEDQPAPPRGQITQFPSQFAGKQASAKVEDLAGYIKTEGADFYIETQPDNIAWLLNVRGDDADFLPAPHSFLLADKDGSVVWFVDPAKINDELRDHLPTSVRLEAFDRFVPTLRECAQPGVTALIDPDFSPSAVRLAFEQAKANVVAKPSWLALVKAKKNPTELEGMRACHIQDGVALAEFATWLFDSVSARAAAGNPVTEREAEAKIRVLRQQRPGFISESFNTISAAGGNASMCHYATTDTRNALILPSQPYLLDSGGQYDTGTTDVTRSFAFGPRPEGYDLAYTAVFKAFHALATLRFPKGTQGHHIDAVCRRPLWDLGLDFDHGTGHGVGQRLSVHEQPQRIGKPYNPVDLVPGMVLSIEPGHYVAGVYGIRLENLFEILEAEDGFLEFRNMTWAPIQIEMLMADKLSRAEKAWLVAYHEDLGKMISPLLSDKASNWMSLLNRQTLARFGPADA